MLLTVPNVAGAERRLSACRRLNLGLKRIRSALLRIPLKSQGFILYPINVTYIMQKGFRRVRGDSPLGFLTFVSSLSFGGDRRSVFFFVCVCLGFKNV